MRKMENWMNPAEKRYGRGVEHILKYGIAFYKKRCRVMLADVDTDH